MARDFADAERFVRHLTRKLGVTDRYIQPGYEDTFYYLWRERRLPVNVDPFDARLDDELERARLRRVFEQKLDSVVGYVLPLQAGEGAGTLAGSVWSTGPWFFRDDRMLLIPGDSPMGYRLPLDALPWVKASDTEHLIPQDPTAPQGPLAAATTLRARYSVPSGPVTGDRDLPYLAGATAPGEARRMAQGSAGGDHARQAGQPDPHAATQPPGKFQSAAGLSRTALCVEVRDPRRASGPKAEKVGEKYGPGVSVHAGSAAQDADFRRCGLPAECCRPNARKSSAVNHLNDSLPTPDPSDSAAQLAAALAPAAAAGHFDELRGATVAGAPGAATASATPKSIANKQDITSAWAQFFDQLGPEGFQDLDRRMQSLHVIRPTWPMAQRVPVLGGALSAQDLTQWSARIEAQGDEYTVQAHLPLSQMPTWRSDAAEGAGQDGGPIAPRSVMLRVFAVCDGPGSWRVLPGGLNVTRLARITLQCLNGEDQTSQPLLTWLSAMGVSQGLVLPTVPAAGQARRVFERSLIAGLTQPAQVTSVGYNLRGILGAASAVRDRLSQEHWNLIVRAEAEFFAPRTGAEDDGDYSPLDALRQLEGLSGHTAAMTGQQTDRMTRDDGWRLLSIGRHLERLGFLASALESGLQTGAVHDEGGFEAMVALFDSTITFHAQYQQRRDMPALLDLLVIDRDNPRSLAWVAQTLRGRIAKIEAAAGTPGESAATGIPEASDLSLVALCAQDAEGRHAALEDYLGRCVRGVMGLSDVLATRYFTHSADALRHSLRVIHETVYHYSPAVQNAQHMAHLRPRTGVVQRVLTHSLQVDPAPTQCNMVQDVFGNTRAFFSLPFTHEQLRVRAESLLETLPVPAAPPGEPWEAVRERLGYRRGQPYHAATEFSFASPYIPRHADFWA
eukprot:gene2947-2988_t